MRFVQGAFPINKQDKAFACPLQSKQNGGRFAEEDGIGAHITSEKVVKAYFPHFH